MEVVDLNLIYSETDISSRSQIIKNMLANQKEEMSIDLLFDIFQNLILDCKYIEKCNGNKYLNNIYKKFESVNTHLYNLRVKLADFNVLKIIGQGAFGQVKLVRHRATGNLYALKILNKAKMMSEEGSTFWKTERDIMTKIESRWIVKVHYAFQDPKRLYMAMDYLPGGNLVNWISTLEEIIESDVCFYMAEMVLAIRALHRFWFVHRDIKPDNILLDNRGHIKLADFGTCVRSDPVTGLVTSTRSVGTPDYISPEVLQVHISNVKYGCEIDWWALGVVLYEIFYGDPPFYSEELAVTYGKIMMHEQTLTFPEDDQISAEAISLIKGLICDRSVRLDVDGIMQHVFFCRPSCLWTWDNIQDCDAPFVPSLSNDWDTSYFDFNEREDVDPLFDNEDVSEIGSKKFGGENLQFSGFSYSEMFYDFNVSQSSSVSHISNEHNIDQEQTLVNDENQRLNAKLQSLARENENVASTLEKLKIDNQNLELELQTKNAKYKEVAAVSNKLQTDYTDLISKHGLCQKKISELEAENQNLGNSLANTQSASTDESRRLLAQIDSLQKELNSLNSQLSDNESEYRKYKLQSQKFERDLKFLQTRYDSLQQELTESRQSNDTQVIDTAHKNRIDMELNDLQSSYLSAQHQLQEHIIENERLTKLISDLRKDNELVKSELEKSSELLRKEIVRVRELDEVVTDKELQINAVNTTLDQQKKKLELTKKVEESLNQKIRRLEQMKIEERKQLTKKSEDQKKEFSETIINKDNDIKELQAKLETYTTENSSLKSELQLEKGKCGALVSKINDIISGNSMTSHEMMIQADVNSGKLDKRSGRRYNEILKQNKKLQRRYDELLKEFSKKDADHSLQMEHLQKDLRRINTENSSLNTEIAYYRSVSGTNNRMKRNSVASFALPSNVESDLYTDITKTPSAPLRNKPKPLTNLKHLSSHYGSTSEELSPIRSPNYDDSTPKPQSLEGRYKKTQVFDSRRVSICDPDTPIYHLPDGQLDVNVKKKGKPMSWEKRYVKFDGRYLLFYDQSIETCFLKLPLTSLVLIRGATTVEIIHAKKSEIQRIFIIIYDKNKTLYSEMKKKLSQSGSTSSVNTVESNKSDDKDVVFSDSYSSAPRDQTMRQDSRRNSLARFTPKFGSKSKTKPAQMELTLDSMDPKAVILKGHIFQPFHGDSKGSCAICKRPLHNDLKAGIDSQIRTIVTERAVENWLSILDDNKNYKCYHCSMKVHGFDLNEKVVMCNNSVVMQFCRAPSKEVMSEWINFHKDFKSHQTASTLDRVSTNC